MYCNRGWGYGSEPDGQGSPLSLISNIVIKTKRKINNDNMSVMGRNRKLWFIRERIFEEVTFKLKPN